MQVVDDMLKITLSEYRGLFVLRGRKYISFVGTTDRSRGIPRSSKRNIEHNENFAELALPSMTSPSLHETIPPIVHNRHQRS